MCANCLNDLSQYLEAAVLCGAANDGCLRLLNFESTYVQGICRVLPAVAYLSYFLSVPVANCAEILGQTPETAILHLLHCGNL